VNRAGPTTARAGLAGNRLSDDGPEWVMPGRVSSAILSARGEALLPGRFTKLSGTTKNVGFLA
jgi:hypothetical protein